MCKESYIYTILIIIIIIIIILNICYTTKMDRHLHLNDSNIKIKVLNFNTSWCGWSKKFQVEWNKLAQRLKHHPHIRCIDVKCDNPINKEVCAEYQIQGYPTVIIELISNNEVNRFQYDGERTATALYNYLMTL